jgi:hypothetical protein
MKHLMGCVVGVLAMAASAHAADLPLPPKKGSPFILVGAGDIAYCSDPKDETAPITDEMIAASVAKKTAQLVRDQLDKAKASGSEALAFTLGDNSYPNSTALSECFGKTWGAVVPPSKLLPIIGNHDREPDYQGEPTLFNKYFKDSPRFRRKKDVGMVYYYRVDIPKSPWVLLMLDSSYYDEDPTIRGVRYMRFVKDFEKRYKEQLVWVGQQIEDLKQNRKCVIAMWHHPICKDCTTFWNKAGDRPEIIGEDSNQAKRGPHMQRLWAALAEKASLALVGDQHWYRRLTPLNAKLEPDPNGLTQIIVGTGGGPERVFTYSTNNTDRSFDAHGVLRLRLFPHVRERGVTTQRASGHFEFLHAEKANSGKGKDEGNFVCR